MYDIIELNKKLVSDLREIATKLKIEKADKLKKEELVYKILDEQAITPIAKPSSSENKGDPLPNRIGMIVMTISSIKSSFKKL